MNTMSRTDASTLAADVLAAVEQAVVGKHRALSYVLAGLLAGGHVLLEDLPGLGKTLAARSFAQALGLEFTRAQFTPDLLPADLSGGFVYNAKTGEFEFRPGPVFTGLLLADEINRTPPKTQAALLEAMQEHQVTVEGRTFPLPRPFHVLATANPIESEGTYVLPEAQLDRFLLRLAFGYPDAEDELDVLQRRIKRGHEEQTVPQIAGPEQVLAMQAAAEAVHVDPQILSYMVNVVRGTRDHDSVLVGSSPRGSLALLSCSRALALVRGRDFVEPEDVKEIAVPALAHRITIRPELWLSRIDAGSVVRDVLDHVTVPDWQPPA